MVNGRVAPDTSRSRLLLSTLDTATTTPASSDAVFQYVLPGMLQDRSGDHGFADSQLEKDMRDMY